MVDTRDLKKFIKLGDLESTDILEFTDEGRIAEQDFSKEQDGSKVEQALVMKASLNGNNPKDVTLNATTINILKKVWGADTAGWVNRRAQVTTVTMLSFGELKDVNVLKPMDDRPINPTTEPSPAAEPQTQPLTPDQQAKVDAGGAWDDD